MFFSLKTFSLRMRWERVLTVAQSTASSIWLWLPMYPLRHKAHSHQYSKWSRNWWPISTALGQAKCEKLAGDVWRPAWKMSGVLQFPSQATLQSWSLALIFMLGWMCVTWSCLRSVSGSKFVHKTC